MFSPDYFTARTRFLDAARAAGAELSAHAVGAAGPRGEPLTIDVATLGPPAARAVVIVSSGLHGVEGFAGSAIQLAWLERRPVLTTETRVKVVFVHALNPFGFAWLRRTNEHNVDLNRNFLTDRSVLESDGYRYALSLYDRLSPFLNPASPPSRVEPYTLRATVEILRRGRRALERALPVGQYEHDRGLFFGGRDVEETTAFVRREAPRWTAGATLAVHLDVHTGLGKWGERRLIIEDAPESTRARWIASQFGAGVQAADDRRAYGAHGTMAADLCDRLRPCNYHGIVAEFGTYSGLRVLGILRAENRAHFYAEPGTPVHRWAKERLAEAFAPRSADWRVSVVGSGVSLVEQAIAVLS